MERSVMPKRQIDDVLNDALNGNGCMMSDKLNLVSLSDKVNVFKDLAAMTKDQPLHIQYGGYHKSETREFGNIMGLHVLPTQGTFSSAFYWEAYDIKTNSGKVDCIDYHFERPGTKPLKNIFVIKY